MRGAGWVARRSGESKDKMIRGQGFAVDKLLWDFLSISFFGGGALEIRHRSTKSHEDRPNMPLVSNFDEGKGEQHCHHDSCAEYKTAGCMRTHGPCTVYWPKWNPEYRYRRQGHGHGHVHRPSCVCMYVCMVITYSRVWINPVRLPILLVVS